MFIKKRVSQPVAGFGPFPKSDNSMEQMLSLLKSQFPKIRSKLKLNPNGSVEGVYNYGDLLKASQLLRNAENNYIKGK